MKRYGNIFAKIIDRDNIRSAARNALRNHRKNPCAIWVEAHMDECVEEIRSMLISGTFKTSKYEEKVIYEPKERIIYILPLYPDRIVQHAIVDVIAPLWDKTFIADSFACREGKGTHAGVVRTAEFVRRYKYDYKYDIRGFYRNINHDILKGFVAEKIKDRRVLALLGEIIDSIEGDVNCPIGNLTSQWFGNIYLNKLDRYVKDVLQVKGYVRYCDDFHIFGDDKSELKWWDVCVTAYVKDILKLEFSKHSLRRTKDGCDFLGYRIFPEKILIRKSTAKRIKKRITGIMRVFERIGDGIGESRLSSMLGSISAAIGVCKHAQAHNFSLSIGLKEAYERVYAKYQAVRGNGHCRDNGRRKSEDKRMLESGDCCDESGSSHKQDAASKQRTQGVCDDTNVLCGRFVQDEAHYLHGISEHCPSSQGSDGDDAVLDRDKTV